MLRRLINLLSNKCPKCNGKLNGKMIDMQFDKLIYECKDCKKLWI